MLGRGAKVIFVVSVSAKDQRQVYLCILYRSEYLYFEIYEMCGLDLNPYLQVSNLVLSYQNQGILDLVNDIKFCLCK